MQRNARKGEGLCLQYDRCQLKQSGQLEQSGQIKPPENEVSAHLFSKMMRLT